MKITIEIPSCYVPILSKWCSVSRTLRESARIIREQNDNESQTYNLEELEEITPALDALHLIVRDAIWVEQAKD